MTIKRILLITVIMMLVVGVTGCRLPASTPPAATATTAGGFPVPGEGGTDTMGMFERFATQTAQAAAGQPPSEGQPPDEGQPPAAETPVPVVPTDTPAPQEAAAPTEQPAEPAARPTRTRVVVPTATPGLPASYTLQKGEFPYCIARRFNINPVDLLNANGLSVNSTTRPGQKLTIPQNARNFPGNRALHEHPTTYTVKTNDTIYTVACYFGDVDPSAIALANGLKEPYRLTAGDRIQIP